MKWKLWTTLALLGVLLSGCIKPTECDWTRTIPFGEQASIDWLLENDRNLLSGIVVHNETRERVCR